jgi:hypothetical protein
MRFLLAAALAFLAALAPSRASATCAVIGDSVAEDLRPFFRECQISTQVGIGTAAITARVPARADVIVVSTGSNDYLTPGLPGRLQALRARAGSARVIWIRPVPQSAAAAVEAVASAHGDAVVAFEASRTDSQHIHPQSSATLAAAVRSHF